MTTAYETPTHDRMLDKVRLLLEHAEGASNDDEAAAYVSKAYDLMSRYSIEESIVFARDREAPAPKVVDNYISVPKDKAGQSLLGVVAQSVGTKIVLNKPWGNYAAKPRITSGVIVGFANDVQMTEVLFTSLLVQMENEKQRALKARPGYENGKRFANSFKWGFVATVRDRLTEVKNDVIKETPGAEVALYAKNERVEAAYNEMFPNLGKNTPANYSVGSAGYGAGAAAGNRAKIDRSPLRDNLTRDAAKAITA